MPAHTAPPPQMALISPCGWGNLGDGAIVESLIHGVRSRVPGVRILGFTLNPADTMQRHGIDAFTISAVSLPFYPIVEPSPSSSPEPEMEPPQSAARTGQGGLARALGKLPIRGRLRTWLAGAVRLTREPRHLRRSVERFQGTHSLVVAGGGQLDGVWGGALGHPYALWRWAHIARASGARFVVASVGTGTLGMASRALVLRALRLADYRSYRDEVSRAMLRVPDLTADDPIVPDLAYGLPVTVRPAARGARLTVGLSPMNYRHPSHWPERDRQAYQQHIRSFASLAARILAAGHEVIVYLTDCDQPAARDMVGALGQVGGEGRSRLRVAETDTLQGLVDVLQRLDVAVAARLHGVILPQVVERPVLAVSHERKVRTLMTDMGLERFCIDIADADSATVFARLEQLIAERDAVREKVVHHVADCRRRVEAQFDLLFSREAMRSQRSAGRLP